MPTRFVNWPEAWRIIPSRYPPIQLYERLTPDPAVWDALIALEQLTNPRVRDEIGEIALVPPDQRVSGPGASYVMASFTHLNPKGSRFSDGSYGVYYAAAALETAIAETIHHFETFAGAAGDSAREEDMRVLVSGIMGDFEDVGHLTPEVRSGLLDPISYSASQTFAKELRSAGSNGITYASVRHPGGECIAAFKPKAISLPIIQERHLRYRWNGASVDRYFDYQTGTWTPR